MRRLTFLVLLLAYGTWARAQAPLVVTQRPWAVAGERLTALLLGVDRPWRVELIDSLGQRRVLLDSVPAEFELELPVALPSGYYRLRAIAQAGASEAGPERVIYCFGLGVPVPPVLVPPRLPAPDVEALQVWPAAGEVAPDDSLLVTVADAAQRDGYAFTLSTPLGEVPLRQLAPGVWQARVLAQVYASVRLRARAASAERNWAWNARPLTRWSLRLQRATVAGQAWRVTGPPGATATLQVGAARLSISLDAVGRAERVLTLSDLPHGPSRLWLVTGSDTLASAWAWRPLGEASAADTLRPAVLRAAGPEALDAAALVVAWQTGAPEALVAPLIEASAGDSLLALHQLMTLGARRAFDPPRANGEQAEFAVALRVELRSSEGAPLSGVPIVGLVEGQTPRLLQGLSDRQGQWMPPAEALVGGRQLRLAALTAQTGASLSVSGGPALLPTAALSPALAYQHWRLLTAYRATQHAAVVRQTLLNAWLAQPNAMRSAELNLLLGRARLDGTRFFEAADDSTRFTDFFTLPDMTELAQNYLLPLSYVKRGGARRARLLAERPKQRYLHSGEPLLVVDGQPMPSFAAFERLKPGLLERAYLLRNPASLVPFGRVGFNGFVVLQSLVGHDQGLGAEGPLARVVLPQPPQRRSAAPLNQRLAAVGLGALPPLLPEASQHAALWRRADGSWVVKRSR